MIIWINGAFGAGKTQTAYELHRRLPGSFVFDPENTGQFIKMSIPEELYKNDFQDHSIWREFNYSMLRYIASEFKGILIVPMTIVNPEYFIEIIERLRAEGLDVRHFTLRVSFEVLLERLQGRGEESGSWPVQQANRCIAGLTLDMFEEYLDTDHLSISETAEKIASILGLGLLSDKK